MQTKHKVLFQSLSLGKLALNNRLALAPTHVGMGGDRGTVTDQILCYYYARAKAGLGLVIVEATGVTGRYAFTPGLGLGAASDHSIPGLRDLASVIHWGNAKAVVQLMAGQGAQALTHQGKRALVGPSAVPALIQREGLPKAIRGFEKMNPEQPRPLEKSEIEDLKASFIRAAERVKKAGFDGVEIHGAHGYLLCQFTSPYFNRRHDDYGGSPERRWRLSVDLIQDIKEKIGQDFVVGYRFSAREGIPGGLELDESVKMAKAIQGAGADYLSVSHGCYAVASDTFPKGEDTFTKDAAEIRKEVSIPVMCANFQDPDRAAAAIEEGSADIIALSRPLLADPLWPEKVKEGRSEEIIHCIRCYECARAAVVEHLPVRCPVNPKLGFERFDPQCFPRPGGKIG
ncbi:MAG: NADH:flavin oxidoreductase [Desulfatiglans sp.]|nr:NADH:flavin oxidoreductase [Thermodesulfobacteriota bacterium]MEE4353961.1 NADH:flavin oxidoreductase [Desulfatiglans sp.]